MASLIVRGKGKHVLRAKTKFAAWKAIERFHYTPTLLGSSADILQDIVHLLELQYVGTERGTRHEWPRDAFMYTELLALHRASRYN